MAILQLLTLQDLTMQKLGNICAFKFLYFKNIKRHNSFTIKSYIIFTSKYDLYKEINVSHLHVFIIVQGI